MATALMREIQQCSICLEGFTIQPKVTPCGHAFCLSCLERYINGRVIFPCPVCKQNIEIPEGGATNFHNNNVVQTSEHTTRQGGYQNVSSPYGHATSFPNNNIVQTSKHTTRQVECQNVSSPYGHATSFPNNNIVQTSEHTTRLVEFQSVSSLYDDAMSFPNINIVQTSEHTTRQGGYRNVSSPYDDATSFPNNNIVQTSKHTTRQGGYQNVSNPYDSDPNFCNNIVQISEHTTKKIKPKCPNHNQKEVNYYCNNCNVGLCYKCVSEQHKEHEALDIECDETRNKAIEKLEHSKTIIQKRIKNLEKTRSSLLESFEELENTCEDSCTKVTEKTEQIVSDLRKRSEQIKEDIRNNLEDNRCKVEVRKMEITSDMNELESTADISPSTNTTLNILQRVPGLMEKEKQGDSVPELYIHYLQWVGNDFSVDPDQLGSVISKKSIFIPGSHQFVFNASEIKEKNTRIYSKTKFRNNNLVWSCRVTRQSDIGSRASIGLLSDDNPTLGFCIIDYQLSLLNIDDDSQTKTLKQRNQRIDASDKFKGFINPVAWSELIDKNNGFLNSNNQFVVQFDLLQIRETEFTQ